MKEWYNAGVGAGREGIGLGKTGTAPGEDMERFGTDIGVRPFEILIK